MLKKLLLSVGTRPEWIKIRPLLPLLDKANIPYKLLYIMQHKDLLDIKEPHEIMQIYDISSNRLDNILLNAIDQAEDWLKGCDAVLVQGDTESAFSVALAAFNRGIKIIHLEAGLRSYDIKNPYPEEMIRSCISRMASIHLCPTKQNAINLSQEGIRTPKYITGNTVLDSIDTTPLPCDSTVLITLHRRENLPIIQQWFTEINKLAAKYTRYKFIFPMHPNPEIQKYKYLLPNIEIIKPLSREDLIIAIKKSILIISDSGGIQEESNYLRKKCIVCRKVTERQESIWLNSTLCKTPEYLKVAFEKMINKQLTDYVCPFGSGDASSKIIEILKKELL